MNEETNNTQANHPESAADARDDAEKPAGAQPEPEQKKEENPQAPAGTTTPQALFDMAPKKKEEPKKVAATGAAGAAGAKAPARPEPDKYPEGTEVRYGREKVVLPKEMTAREVLAWMGEDDYPELKYEEVEVRHDKDKNRLVVVRKAQKKGSGRGGAGTEPRAAR